MSLDQLASEDALRLAVLLASDVHAVRIDEGAMTLHALTPRGEARVALHPDTRAERYLMRVREVLAGHAMGSPGGYPVHLRRWTRSGHASPKNLEALLRLGEPEAVTAVSLSAHLTDELARRAWWAQPTSDIARAMLGHDAVRRGAMGPVLAQHLLEHLPFEEDPDTAIASVAAVAAAGLLDDAARERLWRSAQHRPHYLIGWLEHAPLTLPPAAALAVPAAVEDAARAGHPLAALLVRCASAEGQGVLRALALALEKPPTHDATFRVLDVTAAWFAAARDAPALAGVPPEVHAAVTALAATGRAAAEPILGRTTAVGPLMRRHLAPVLQPLLQHLQVLRTVP
ncbi:hypothetical protein [Azohydromonas sediminis]|uniref:hypothetical protein n=1 Tax=Azohydromonas sediminis TaxID=2259674 RepID=UPI000E65B09D|nr:hypothetical protein [Azohydromonas sediminis]